MKKVWAFVSKYLYMFWEKVKKDKVDDDVFRVSEGESWWNLCHGSFFGVLGDTVIFESHASPTKKQIWELWYHWYIESKKNGE